MTPEEISELIKHTLLTAIELGAPFLILALLIGFIIGILQSYTQIHEMTLSFVPKMLVVTLSIALFFPWILKMMVKFTHNVWIYQWEKIITSWI